MGEAKSKNGRLTPQRKLFCAEYLTDYDGTRAAIAAGYSKQSARAQASQLLQVHSVQKELYKKQNKITKKLDMTSENLLKEIAAIALYEVGKKIRNEEKYINGHSGPTYADKLAAIDKAMKHLGMFKEDGTSLNINVKIEGRDADCG